MLSSWGGGCTSWVIWVMCRVWQFVLGLLDRNVPVFFSEINANSRKVPTTTFSAPKWAYIRVEHYRNNLTRAMIVTLTNPGCWLFSRMGFAHTSGGGGGFWIILRSPPFCISLCGYFAFADSPQCWFFLCGFEQGIPCRAFIFTPYQVNSFRWSYVIHNVPGSFEICRMQNLGVEVIAQISWPILQVIITSNNALRYRPT